MQALGQQVTIAVVKLQLDEEQARGRIVASAPDLMAPRGIASMGFTEALPSSLRQLATISISQQPAPAQIAHRRRRVADQPQFDIQTSLRDRISWTRASSDRLTGANACFWKW